MPTANYSHSNVRPLDSEGEVNQMLQRIVSLQDIAAAAKVLLGAQSAQVKLILSIIQQPAAIS